MTTIRFPIMVATLCTSAFCYAQAPPAPSTGAAQGTDARAMPADIVREAPRAAPPEAQPADQPPTNAMGADGTSSPAVAAGDMRARVAPVRAPDLGLGRYGYGYLP